MGCSEALYGWSPVVAQTKLQSIIYILPWKKGKDFFFFSSSSLAELHSEAFSVFVFECQKKSAFAPG